MNCPGHITPFKPQLGDGVYGPFDCTANSAAMAIDYASCGTVRLTGAQVRAQSSEPKPDPDSPGLNLPQVAAVAAKHGIYFDVRIGSRAVAWSEYEARRIAGQGCLGQLLYLPISKTFLDAGGGFKGNHAWFETRLSTYEPLADGRRPGIHKYDGRSYPRGLVLQSMASLNIGGGDTPLPGRVWAAFTRDVVPDYFVEIRPVAPAKKRDFANYTVHAGLITSGKRDVTAGFSAKATAPQAIKDASTGKYRYLVKLLTGSRKNDWVAAGWAREV